MNNGNQEKLISTPVSDRASSISLRKQSEHLGIINSHIEVNHASMEIEDVHLRLNEQNKSEIK